MGWVDSAKVESNALSDFARVLPDPQAAQAQASRLTLEPDDVKNGLGQLVLTLVKLLHELLERQAIQRIAGGSLNDDEIERLGITLMRQAQEIERLRLAFGLEEKDLNLDLGPLGKVF